MTSSRTPLHRERAHVGSARIGWLGLCRHVRSHGVARADRHRHGCRRRDGLCHGGRRQTGLVASRQRAGERVHESRSCRHSDVPADGQPGVSGGPCVGRLQAGLRIHRSSPGRLGARHHRWLRRIRRGVWLSHCDHRDVRACRAAGDAATRLFAGARLRRCRLGRHARHHRAAVVESW